VSEEDKHGGWGGGGSDGDGDGDGDGRQNHLYVMSGPGEVRGARYAVRGARHAVRGAGHAPRSGASGAPTARVGH